MSKRHLHSCMHTVSSGRHTQVGQCTQGMHRHFSHMDVLTRTQATQEHIHTHTYLHIHTVNVRLKGPPRDNSLLASSHYSWPSYASCPGPHCPQVEGS